MSNVVVQNFNIEVRSELIGDERVNAINARDLHEALEIKRKFTDWINHQIESLMLEEDTDFTSFHQKVKRETGATIRKEYILTLDAAKHIALASRTQIGKQIRQYFIEVEKRTRYESQIAQGFTSMIKAQEEELKALKEKELELKDKLIAQLELNVELLKRSGDTLKKSIIAYGRWSIEETNRLITLYGLDYSVSMIAKDLNRTYRAVKEKIKRLRREGVLQ